MTWNYAVPYDVAIPLGPIDVKGFQTAEACSRLGVTDFRNSI